MRSSESSRKPRGKCVELKADIESLRGELKADIERLRTDPP